jgi:hypothetical protein
MRTQTLAPVVSIPQKKAGAKTGLFIDIGSATVSAGLATYGGSDVPEMHYAVSAPIAVKEPGNFEHLLEEALAALDVALDKTLKEGLPATARAGKTFETITVTLASPWFVSSTHLVSHAAEKPFTVHGSLIRSLIDEAKKEGKGAEKGTLLEEAVIRTTVNGYPTTRPEGKRGVDVRLALYRSFAEPSVLARITEHVGKVFPHKKVQFHSFTLVSFQAMRNIYPEKDQLILLDVAGEVTDMTVVLDDTIVATYSFPIGISSVVRHAAPAASSPEEAASLVAMQSAGVLKKAAASPAPETVPPPAKEQEQEKEKETGVAETAAPVLPEGLVAEAAKKWSDAFIEALKSGCESCPLPRTIFLSTDAPAAQWFESLIMSADTSSLGLRRHGFQVIPVDARALQRFIALSGDWAAFDPFLALAVVFSHIERFE